MRTARILVVDDDPNMRLLIEYNLQRKGHRTATVADGPSAIRKATEGDFDLIILDVMLPEEAGFEICQRLRKEPRTRDVPIILVTARSRIEDFESASKVGATDYITKPFDPLRLVEQVESHLQAHRGSP